MFFWTNQPGEIGLLYEDNIMRMQPRFVLVLKVAHIRRRPVKDVQIRSVGYDRTICKVVNLYLPPLSFARNLLPPEAGERE